MNGILKPINPTIYCYACASKIDIDDQFCNSCGCPAYGTSEEKEKFRTAHLKSIFKGRDYEKRIKQATNTLYWLTGAIVLEDAILFFDIKDEPDVLNYVLPDIILAMVFLALGGYANKKPLACIISGLVLYIIIQLLNVITDPASFVSPIALVIKVAIIAFLINGVKSALEVDKIKKRNNIV